MTTDGDLYAVLEARTLPLEEHIERLRAVHGDDLTQIRHHLYRAVYDDVKWSSTEDDSEHEAHSAALLAVSDAMAILRAPVPTPPALFPRERLLDLLSDVQTLVRADDSAEGSITYAWSPTPGIYEVSAFVRTGNSLGQGGCLLVNATTFPADADHDGVEEDNHHV